MRRLTYQGTPPSDLVHFLEAQLALLAKLGERAMIVPAGTKLSDLQVGKKAEPCDMPVGEWLGQDNLPRAASHRFWMGWVSDDGLLSTDISHPGGETRTWERRKLLDGGSVSK